MKMLKTLFLSFVVSLTVMILLYVATSRWIQAKGRLRRIEDGGQENLDEEEVESGIPGGGFYVMLFLIILGGLGQLGLVVMRSVLSGGMPGLPNRTVYLLGLGVTQIVAAVALWNRKLWGLTLYGLTVVGSFSYMVLLMNETVGVIPLVQATVPLVMFFIVFALSKPIRRG